MTRQTLVPTFLACALAVLATSTFAAARPSYQQVAVSQATSDSNLRWAFHRIEENIDMLNADQGDFGGFRAKAITLFQDARKQILAGLRFDNGREDVPPPVGFVRPDNDMRVLRGECASDANLNVVRRNIERIVDVLQRDNHDYGGHRVAAIKLLNEGREMLKSAIAFDDTH